MKKLIITLSVLSIISFFTFASIYNVNQDVQREAKRTQTAHAEELIKQSYTVIEVHSKYIVTESNKHKNELINFYYADQSKKQTFNTNDKVVAYFKPYKNSYKIVDFKKVAEKVSTYDYVITSIQSDGIYGKSLNDDTGVYLTKTNVKGLKLSVNDSIRVSFLNNDYETITNVTKLNTIAETFIITSINNGQFKGENTHSGTDKNRVIFTQSDMKNTHSIHVGDTVTAIYKPLKGEDQFLYVN
jgi:type II secretory pathway pseudopilin PulG